MPSVDPATGEVSNIVFGADTGAALAGDSRSIFDSVGNFFAKGLPLTGLAVFNSFANSGIEVANWFGADTEPFDIEKQMRSIGLNDYADYYAEHSQGIEVAGFAAGSLLPGLGAIKLLKMAQVGEFSGALMRATNFMAGPKKRIIEEGLQTIADQGAMYNSLRADKWKAIALGFGDQALQALAYETATAATMFASPIFDKESLADSVQHVIFGALLGGGIGGVFEAIGTNAAFKGGLAATDAAMQPWRVSRQYGYVDNATINGSPIYGDRVAALNESIRLMPKDFPSEAARRVFNRTESEAVQQSQMWLQKLGRADDTEPANALWQVVSRIFRDTGMDPNDAHTLLGRLTAITRIGETAYVPARDGFYINHFTAGEWKIGAAQLDQLIADVAHPGSDVSTYWNIRPGYTMGDIKIGHFAERREVIPGFDIRKYVDVQDAFDQGVDIFVYKSGKVHVNKNSSVLEGRAPIPGQSRTLTAAEYRSYTKTGELPPDSSPLWSEPLTLRVRDGSIVTNPTPVIADLGAPVLEAGGNALRAGNSVFHYGVEEGMETLTKRLTSITPETDTVALSAELSGRYTWAEMRGLRAGDEISMSDIPMLEALHRRMASYKDWNQAVEDFLERGVTIAGDEFPATELAFRNMLQDAKDDLIHTLMQEGNLSADMIARAANVPTKYLENGGNAQVLGDLIRPFEEHTTLQHVNLTYDITRMNVQDGQIIRGIADVQRRIQVLKDAAEAAVRAEFGQRAADLKIDLYSSADAVVEGVRAGFFSFANAGYSTLGNAVQRMGTFVEKLKIDRINNVMDTFVRQAAALRQDPIAFAEASAFTAVRHRTGENYVFLPPDIAKRHWMSEDTVVLEHSLVRGPDGRIVDWNKSYTPTGFYPAAAKVDPNANQWDFAAGPHTFYHLSPAVAAWERAHMEINNARVISTNRFYAAQGVNKELRLDILYAPPIDTTKTPYFFYVRDPSGFALGDGGIAIVTARTAEELAKKELALGNEFQVFTKEALKREHMIRGEYDFQRNFMQTRVNAELARRGVLNDIMPEANVDTYIQNYVAHHARGETRVIRDYAELSNAQLFAEIDSMSKRYTELEQSKTGFFSRLINPQPRNPYESYIKTALGITDNESYPMWKSAQQKVEAFAGTAFDIARSAFFAAKSGQLRPAAEQSAQFAEAVDIARRAGLGPAYDVFGGQKAYAELASTPAEKRILTDFISRANAALGATTVRLDAFQNLINVISTPILMLTEAASAKGVAHDLWQAQIPGTMQTVPATTKVLFKSIANWFDKDIRNQYMPMYTRIGAVRDISSDFANLVDNVTLPYGDGMFARMQAQAGRIVDSASNLLGTRYAEQFVRFITADAGRQLFEAMGHRGSALQDNVLTFVNRVHGNYVASQRPIAFQGPIGQAIGMFQTYQMNLMQQLFRYVEDRDAKAVAIMMGLQSTIFGLQGLPGFQLLNKAVIGNAPGNTGHADAYSILPNYMDKGMADWLLYGVASNVMQAGLYTRGDINPRQLTVLPVNPLDYPAINGGIQLISNLLDTMGTLVQGGDVATTFLRGLEHNGLSRPLAGLAQLAQGFVTTKEGSLVSVTRGGMEGGWNDIISAANFSRILGARPLEEAIVMDAAYRSSVYLAKDATRQKALGETAKSWLYGQGAMPSGVLDNFMLKYAAAGGDIRNFSQTMMRWAQDANVGVANQIFKALDKPLNKNLMQIMGGQPLPDFMNTGTRTAGPVVTAPASTSGAPQMQQAGMQSPMLQPQ